MTASHTHFCWKCFTHRGSKNRRGPRGWWRCIDPKCVREMSSVCPEHQKEK